MGDGRFWPARRSYGDLVLPALIGGAISYGGVLGESGVDSRGTNLAPTGEPGGFGCYSIEFDGVDDVALTEPNIFTTAQMVNGTVELWLRSGTPGKVDGDGPEEALFDSEGWLWIRKNTDGTAGAITDGTGQNIANTTGRINDGRWHHVAVVWAGGSFTEIYLGGVLEGTANPENSPRFDSHSRPTSFGNDHRNLSPYGGKLDEVRVWNRALGQDELQANMLVSLDGDEAGLVAYWNVNSGSGSVLYDQTGHMQHGAIEGALWSTDVPFDGVRLVRRYDPTVVYLGDLAYGDWMLESCPETGFDYWISVEEEWLDCSPDAGAVPPDSTLAITLTYDSAELLPAEYHADVTITWADTYTIVERVSLTVLDPMELEREPGPDFLYSGESAANSWLLTNASSQNAHEVSFDDSCPWLSIEPASVVVPADSSAVVTAHYNAEGLAPAAYDCTVRYAYAGIMEQEVEVNLNVLSPLAEIVRLEEPDSVYVTDRAEGLWELGNLSVGNSLEVSIDADCDWLSFEPARVVIAPDSTAELELLYDTVGLSVGSQRCTATLTYADSLTVELPVTLEVVSPVSVRVTSFDDPVRRGERVVWRFELANDTAEFRGVEVWFDAYLIGGGAYPRNPIDGPYSGRLSPEHLATYRNVALIPADTPLGGAYRICTRAGVAPEQAWSEDCFEFSVSP